MNDWLWSNLPWQYRAVIIGGPILLLLAIGGVVYLSVRNAKLKP